MARGTIVCLGLVLVVAITSTVASAVSERTVVFHMHFSTGGIVFGPVDDVFAGTATQFGKGVVFDNIITSGEDQSSTELGRARGLYFYSALDSSTNSMEEVFTVVFGENSKYEGATLSFRGMWLEGIQRDRQMSVVGGTGSLQNSFGYAVFHNIPGTYTYEVTCHIAESTGSNSARRN